MSGSFLERALGTAIPSFEVAWRELRRTYPPETPPSAEDFLGHLVAHVQHSLTQGRVAEVTRLFLAIERLLGEADPILAELLERRFLAVLAAECRDAAVAPGLVLPHLGPRARAAWDRALRC